MKIAAIPPARERAALTSSTRCMLRGKSAYPPTLVKTAVRTATPTAPPVWRIIE
jgi:hypothetical protein